MWEWVEWSRGWKMGVSIQGWWSGSRRKRKGSRESVLSLSEKDWAWQSGTISTPSWVGKSWKACRGWRRKRGALGGRWRACLGTYLSEWISHFPSASKHLSLSPPVSLPRKSHSLENSLYSCLPIQAYISPWSGSSLPWHLTTVLPFSKPTTDILILHLSVAPSHTEYGMALWLGRSNRMQRKCH